MSEAGRTYAAALLAGLAAAAMMLPFATMLGTGGLWRMPDEDAAVALTGHLAFQSPGWHWPLLMAPDLAWPAGRSIALTDSNPLVSLLAKLVSGWRGERCNLLGPWLALCWVMQPVSAVYALRGFWRVGRHGSPPWEAALAAAVLSLLCPAWLARCHHINLLGHFVLLLALGLSVRMAAGNGRGWWPARALLTAAILIHPYLFCFAAVVLGAPVLKHALDARRLDWASCLAYAASCVGPVMLLFILSGGFGGRASGFGLYSMNLVSPVWPQLSGLFGAGLTIVDATGGQYEGFNYQGAGVLLLDAAACFSLLRRPLRSQNLRRIAVALGAPLLVLTCVALTPRVYAGYWLVLQLPLWPASRLLDFLQSSGRAFWIVGYALSLAALTVLAARWHRAALLVLLFVAAGLQGADTWPVASTAHAYFAGLAEHEPVFELPDGARLLRIVPACNHVNRPADLLRLVAARQGMRLADMRLARQPPGFNCEAALADGTEAALQKGELRLFLPELRAPVRQAALGPGVLCRRNADGLLCTLDVPNTLPGSVEPMGAAIAALPPPPFTLQGAAIGALISSGWSAQVDGAFWSEGPYATLLFRPPEGQAQVGKLAIRLEGVAHREGGTRTIMLHVDGGAAQSLTLPDLTPAWACVPLPPAPSARPIRIVFEATRPVDPRNRDLVAPVHRAAIKLRALAMQGGACPP